MRKTVLKAILLAFVPVSGLISCAKEKTVQDQFDIGEPKIVTQSGVQLRISQASTQNFPPSARLTFKNLDDYNFDTDPVTHTVTTVCNNVFGRTESVSEHRNVSEIRLQDLLPANAYAGIGTTDTVLDCTMNVVARNKHKSENVLAPINVKVAVSPQFGELKTQSQQASTQSTAQSSTQTQSPLSFLESKEISHQLRTKSQDDREKHQLVCEGFWMKLDSAFIEGQPIADEKVLSYSARQLISPKQLGRQQCRLVREFQDAARHVEVSPLIEVQFDIPVPEIVFNESRFLTGELAWSTGKWFSERQTFGTFTLENKSSKPMKLLMLSNAPEAVQLQAISDVVGGKKNLAMQLHVDGTYATKSGYISFEIAPGGKRTIQAHGFPRFGCRSRGGLKAGFIAGAYPHLKGFYYEINESQLAVFVQQTEDNNSGTVNSKTYKTVPLVKNPTSSMMTGLANNMRWAPVFMNGDAVTGAPQVELTNVSKSALNCDWH